MDEAHKKAQETRRKNEEARRQMWKEQMEAIKTAKRVLLRVMESEKEDAFLLRVLETIRAGLNQSTPLNAADTLLRLLQGTQPQPIHVEEVSQEDQQETDETALDFVDSF